MQSYTETLGVMISTYKFCWGHRSAYNTLLFHTEDRMLTNLPMFSLLLSVRWGQAGGLSRALWSPPSVLTEPTRRMGISTRELFLNFTIVLITVILMWLLVRSYQYWEAMPRSWDWLQLSRAPTAVMGCLSQHPKALLTHTHTLWGASSVRIDCASSKDATHEGCRVFASEH